MRCASGALRTGPEAAQVDRYFVAVEAAGKFGTGVRTEREFIVVVTRGIFASVRTWDTSSSSLP